MAIILSNQAGIFSEESSAVRTYAFCLFKL